MPRLLTPGMTLQSPLRAGTPLGGPPLIMPARIHVPTTTALLNGTGAGMPPPLIAAGDASAGMMFAPYAAAAEYAAANYAALNSPLLAEYPPDAAGGLFAR